MSMIEWDFKRLVSHAETMQATIVKQAAEIVELKQAFGVLQKYTEPTVGKWNFDKCVEWVGSFDTEVEVARPICEANDAAWAANQLLLKKLVGAIEAAGISSTYRKQKGRSYYKTESVSHDWYASLRGAVVAPFYTVKWLDDLVSKVKAKRTENEAAKERERKRREADQAALEEQRKRTVVIVEVAKELGVDPVSADKDSLVRLLRHRDKYLDLAIAMSDTRGDWSDGFWRVSDALRRFTPETAQDGQIVAEVSNLCHGDESDGRVFRDCTWNYSVLFGLADKSLVALHERLCA